MLTARQSWQQPLPQSDTNGDNCTPTLLTHPSSGRFRLCVHTVDGQLLVLDSRGTAPPGTWTHIGLTLSRQTVALYVNGKLDGRLE